MYLHTENKKDFYILTLVSEETFPQNFPANFTWFESGSHVPISMLTAGKRITFEHMALKG